MKRKHAPRLLAHSGLVSVGLGRDGDRKPAIVIGMDRARPETAKALPQSLEGYPVVIRVIGPVTAQ